MISISLVNGIAFAETPRGPIALPRGPEGIDRLYRLLVMSQARADGTATTHRLDTTHGQPTIRQFDARGRELVLTDLEDL